jgi:hypothetical protein
MKKIKVKIGGDSRTGKLVDKDEFEPKEAPKKKKKKKFKAASFEDYVKKSSGKK